MSMTLCLKENFVLSLCRVSNWFAIEPVHGPMFSFGFYICVVCMPHQQWPNQELWLRGPDNIMTSHKYDRYIILSVCINSYFNAFTCIFSIHREKLQYYHKNGWNDNFLCYVSEIFIGN